MADYEIMTAQLGGLLEGSEWYITGLANASALIWDCLDNINWAGFYIMRGGSLQLGPFQGRPACMTISVGKGVCGTAAAEDRTILVPDVHEFPGHIACDTASNSEIVIPIHRDGLVWGVLDIDSPVLNRFTEEDRAGLEGIVKVIEQSIERSID